MPKSLKHADAIRADFLAALADEGNSPTYNDVIEFGLRLQEEVGMDSAAAAHTLTSWAIAAGVFSAKKNNLEQVEKNAKTALESVGG
jgi:hypothetical protein